MVTQQMTADQLMSSNVVTVAPKDTLREAMSLMVDSHVGALPVVDSKGRVVGVVSATDILNREYEQSEEPDHLAATDQRAYFDSDVQRWESISVYRGVDEIPNQRVEEVMNQEIIFVHPQTSIGDVAQAMLTQGIHHILVIDEDRRLHGIISSLDFVRLAAAN